jgi:predicted AAA+ superfamily ATPase
MKLRPWYDVVKPREDLREGKPLDASEFAVHLDKVRLGTAPPDYTTPERFFDRTYLTESLTGLASEVVRRLSGVTTETSAVFNMTTQFGGGKTHALTLLYHLAHAGSKAELWRGVSKIRQRAGIKSIPDNCAVAVFVGTEFDSVTGRGGMGGTPLRKTPWGEIAFQLGGAEAFAHVAQHDKEFIEPKGDVIEKFLPAGPCLILMDEVLNYMSTYRDRGHHNKLYNFLQALSETVRGRKNAVLVGSIPASELAYTDRDHADQQRMKNLLDRVGKAVILAVEAETSEIIRRRLFEWDERAVTADGRVLLHKDAHDTCGAYAEWVQEHRQQLPNLINPDLARDQFLAAYPFHPMVLSVFERKWQTLPRFQQTRGILRLLALWVSRAYQDGYKGAQKDALIAMGTAPLEDASFRAAVFEQLGETKLEAAVTTDITGKKDSHAVRLDAEAADSIRKGRLHRKAATAIFFESNGGQMGTEAQEASVAEIRLAVGEPETDIGNVETVLEALTEACYYLIVEKTRYKFSLKENLNKRFADRRATVQASEVDEQVKREIQRIFAKKEQVDVVPFPEKSGQVADRPILTLVVGSLAYPMDDERATRAFAEEVITKCNQNNRHFKSAVLFVAADSAQAMREDARKWLAWEAIQDEAHEMQLDESQKRQLRENVEKAKRDLRESIWRSYKHVLLLGKDNRIKEVDLGLVHSSAADTPVSNVINRLVADGDAVKGVSPNYLVRNWPPAMEEWSIKSVRDVFYASPLFPRLLAPESFRDTIAQGVEGGLLAYVGKTSTGGYEPFVYKTSLSTIEIELGEDTFIIRKEKAEAHIASNAAPAGPDSGPGEIPAAGQLIQGQTTRPQATATGVTPAPTGGTTPAAVASTSGFAWEGEIPAQKWMNFYTKVVSRFATGTGVKLTLRLEVVPQGGVPASKVEEARAALRELGLRDDLKPKS